MIERSAMGDSVRMAEMLNLWRRHTPKCPHRHKGRDFIRCKCPIWVDGELNGKRFRRSTGLKDWQRALRKATAWESQETGSIKPISEATAAFLLHCRDLSDATRIKYRNVMGQLEKYCAREGATTVAELSVELLDGFRASRRIGLLTSTKELHTLRQFCGFCVERKWLSENVAKKVKPPKNVKPAPVEPFTEQEGTRLLFACGIFGRSRYERLRARGMILLLRHTALRISDVATLARDRIQGGEMFLHTLKTGGTVKLPLPPELLQALEILPLPKDADTDCPYYF